MAARWLTSSGARLPVHMTGRGTPLVLLHGWAMDHRIFRPQEDAFARQFRVISWDRRGFGRSEGRPDLDLELDDIDAVDRAFTREPFHLLGLSQGGRVALRYAATRPARVRSLILQGPAVDGMDAGPDDERIPMDEFAALARAGRVDEVRRRWLQHPMMRLGKGHSEAEALLRHMLADYSGADLLEHRRVAQRPPPKVIEALAEAGLPVLVLTGARETQSRRQCARLLVDALPRAREVLLGGSGHFGNLSEPERYNAAVIDFLTDLDGNMPEPSDAGPGD